MWQEVLHHGKITPKKRDKDPILPGAVSDKEYVPSDELRGDQISSEKANDDNISSVEQKWDGQAPQYEILDDENISIWEARRN